MNRSGSMLSKLAWLLPALFLLLVSALPALAIDPAAKINRDPPADLVRSACEYNYPPYCVVTPDNQAGGFSVELLRAALGAMGREVSFQVDIWDEVKQKLVDGRVQVLPLVGRTPEREAVFDFTFPYLTMHGTIVVRKDEAGIADIDDLKGKQVAVLKGDNAEEFLRSSKVGATIVTTRTFEEALRQLSGGQHDAVVIQKLLALQLISGFNLSNLKTVGKPLDGFVQSFCFAVRKGDAKLLGLLNEGLALVMADGTFQQLYIKWFGPIEISQLKKSRIVIGGDFDYPPYEFLDNNGQPTGYNVELTRSVAREAGLDVEIRLGPWGEIRQGLTDGDIDVVQGMFYSPERDRIFDFSPAHSVVSHVIVTRKGTTIPDSMAALAGKSILVMNGDIMHDAATKFGYEKQLVLVKSQEEALRLLASGRYDCALVAKIPALYWMNRFGWDNLQISEFQVAAPEYCYAVPHGSHTLLSRLSEGLSAVKATGEYRSIYSKWLGVYEKAGPNGRDILRYSLIVLVPGIALLVGSLLWNRALNRKVKTATTQLNQIAEERKHALEALREKNLEMEHFLYAVSHDLKSPVVTIKGFTGILEGDLSTGDTKSVASSLAYINKAADRLGELLGDLLDFSRIGRVERAEAEYSFREVVDAALVMVSGAVIDRQVDVCVEDVDLRLKGDYSRLLEIWQNLLENAVKYMGGQTAPRIDVGVQQRGSEMVFFVRDNGIGVDPRYHLKIFGLFEKLDPNSEGTGLGLALVKRIVELQQGHIWVESEGSGKGSTFYFTLPAATNERNG